MRPRHESEFDLVAYTDVRIGDIITTTDGESPVTKIENMSKLVPVPINNGQPPLHITLANGVNRLFMPLETIVIIKKENA